MDLTAIEARVRKLSDKQLIDGVANYCMTPINAEMRETIDPVIDCARKEIERRQKENG